MSVFARKPRFGGARASVAGLVVALSLVAPDAEASENYPQTLERALDAPCPPDCTTCHTRPTGGNLTANTPVGISMRRAGLKGGDTSLLYDAIATLEADATDSDTDGTPDVDEIRAGTDPNAAEGRLKCFVPEPEGGCSVARSSLAARTSGERFALHAPVVAFLALALGVRRRRSPRPAR